MQQVSIYLVHLQQDRVCPGQDMVPGGLPFCGVAQREGERVREL